MERRNFLRVGLAAGAWGVGAAVAVTPARGAQPAVLPLRRRAPGPLRLSANENPLGIAPSARQAVMRGMAAANRYPDQVRGDLIDAIAEHLGVTPEHIVLGAGSTDVLRMLVLSTHDQGGRFVVATPTFEDIVGYSRPFGPRLDEVPLRPDGSHDIPRMRESAERGSDPVLVFVCNPNNPTGTLTRCAEVDEWIESAPERVTFIVDEAYFHYVRDASYWSSVKWVHERPNVVVARTFSKIYAMAGMRVGFGVADPATARRLRAFQGRNNVSNLSLLAAKASLEDEEFARRSFEANNRGKAILYAALDELGLEYLPSHTNFVMHRIKGDLETYIARMRERNIRVGRPFPPMLEYNRISIGLPEEMEVFVDALRDFRGKGWL